MYKSLALLVAAAFLPLAVHAATVSATVCTENYQPVCAAHQVECFAAPCYPVYQTYSNSCFMDAANATLIHDGACSESETGMIKPATTTPVATTTAPPPAHGFFYRLWHWFLNLFR